MSSYQGESGSTTPHTSLDLEMSNTGISNCSTRNSYIGTFLGMSCFIIKPWDLFKDDDQKILFEAVHHPFV